ncbi:hypothetical protein OQA88_9317 [Cercophora sp. LCS_1]
MAFIGDYRPGKPNNSTPRIHHDNLLDDPAYRTKVGFDLVSAHMRRLPEIPADGVSVCAACSAIKLDDIDTEEGYRHSESYHALSASSMRGCPLCLMFFQILHSHSGIGDPNQALVILNPHITGRPIHLRAIRDDQSGKIRTINVRIESWPLSSKQAGLRIFALPGTAAARRGFQLGVPFGESEKWAAMKAWLARETAGPNFRGTRQLPTRLIDVGKAADNCNLGVRLVETSSLPLRSDLDYAALSYRWGATNTVTTIQSNLKAHVDGIILEQLPRTIRDAVHATRRLGLKYLWVDCLCIVQDDRDDWAREAARMGDVYMNAHCTLATHSAQHADDGFLEESMGREKVVAAGGHPGSEPFGDELAAYNTFAQLDPEKIATEVTSNMSTSETLFFSKGSYARHHLDRSELSSRGWVLQERVLSPRVIHFGPRGSIYFETRAGVEHIETGVEANYHPFPGLTRALEKLDLEHLGATVNSETAELAYNGWYEVLMRYSACSLSKAQDRLIAVSGVAQKMEKLTGDTFVDGLWMKTFHFCLLWLSQDGALMPNVFIQAPTWSWTSVEGKVQHPHGTLMLSIASILPELQLAGIKKQSPPDKNVSRRGSVLQLDNVVKINTHLRFLEGRIGLPWWDNTVLHIGLEHETRYWDVYADDGRHLGWASLDFERRAALDGLAEAITCIKVASNNDDRPENGWDRGYMVLFIAYSADLCAWRRVGMGQILDRKRFDMDPVGILLA